MDQEKEVREKETKDAIVRAAKASRLGQQLGAVRALPDDVQDWSELRGHPLSAVYSVCFDALAVVATVGTGSEVEWVAPADDKWTSPMEFSTDTDVLAVFVTTTLLFSKDLDTLLDVVSPPSEDPPSDTRRREVMDSDSED